MIQGHVDCDQVSQHQRGGENDADIAKATGHSLADVQSCSQTSSSGGRETANNYQDQPHLPFIPTITGARFTHSCVTSRSLSRVAAATSTCPSPAKSPIAGEPATH